MFLTSQLISFHQNSLSPSISKFQRFLKQGSIPFAKLSSRLAIESNAFWTKDRVDELLGGVYIHPINGIERDIGVIIFQMAFLVHLETMLILPILEESLILTWGIGTFIGLYHNVIFEMCGIRNQPIHGGEGDKGFSHAVIGDIKQSFIASREQELEVGDTAQKGWGIANPFVNVFSFPGFIDFFVQ